MNGLNYCCPIIVNKLTIFTLIICNEISSLALLFRLCSLISLQETYLHQCVNKLCDLRRVAYSQGLGNNSMSMTTGLGGWSIIWCGMV